MNPLFLAGANAIKHSLMRTLSVICVLLVCMGLYWAVYRTFIKPRATENYSQIVEAGGRNTNIEIYNPEDTFFFGCRIWGLKIGISKPTIKKMEEVVKEAEAIK